MKEVEYRKAEKFEKGNWRAIAFRSLKNGDRFRLSEGDGKWVVSEGGFIAHSDAKSTKDNPEIWEIEVKEYKVGKQ